MNTGTLRYCLRKHFPGLWSRLARRSSRSTQQGTAEEIFTDYYRSNFWGAESRSGGGSTLAQTIKVRTIVESVIASYDVRLIVDIPCGDFFWMQHVDFKGAEYLGLDVVAQLAEKNRENFGTEQISFRTCDLLSGPVPTADLIICRDALVHFSYDDIRSALNSISQSNSRYLLTTTFPETGLNWNIRTGDWRPLNLEIAPFDMPPPIDVFPEDSTEQSGTYRDKSLALFEVSKIAAR